MKNRGKDYTKGKIELKMWEFVELWENGPQFAQSEHFRLGTDSILLSDFVNTTGKARGIDLGCGSGILPLLLLWRSDKLHMTGLEILPEAAEIAGANIGRNGLSSRFELVCGDIRQHRSLFGSGAFDLVVSNPPYFPGGSGKLSPIPERAQARGEMSCTLDELCSAAAYLCRTGGAFFMVHRAERCAEVMGTLSAKGLEPKRLRFVAHSADRAPSLMLIEARRGAKPGVRVMPTLCLRSAGGSETDETRRIYHREV